jgi:riboflavin kinase/FMN adenylyltransferase
MALKKVSFIVRGIVEHGFAVARSSGYPTANLALSEPLAIPHGIYCARTTVQESDESIPSIVFYGIPYAISSVTEPRFEVHLLEKNATLYGQELTVQLIAFVRENKKFDDVAGLQCAIDADMAVAREYFNVVKLSGPGKRSIARCEHDEICKAPEDGNGKIEF